MNEFEWRRQMQGLRQPLQPTRDLWASIDAALEDTPPVATPARRTPRRKRDWLLGAGLAASLVLAVSIGWHALHTTTAGMGELSFTSSWKPADPRFGGAALELDAARMELRQAMQQAPDSPALQRLLIRTEHQQTQLRQLAREAS